MVQKMSSLALKSAMSALVCFEMLGRQGRLQNQNDSKARLFYTHNQRKLQSEIVGLFWLTKIHMKLECLGLPPSPAALGGNLSCHTTKLLSSSVLSNRDGISLREIKNPKLIPCHSSVINIHCQPQVQLFPLTEMIPQFLIKCSTPI